MSFFRTNLGRFYFFHFYAHRTPEKTHRFHHIRPGIIPTNSVSSGSRPFRRCRHPKTPLCRITSTRFLYGSAPRSSLYATEATKKQRLRGIFHKAGFYLLKRKRSTNEIVRTPFSQDLLTYICIFALFHRFSVHKTGVCVFLVSL